MLNGIVASLIGLAGGLLAALLVAWHQAKNTKALIAAEFDKLERQNQSAFRSRKEQWLLDCTPELLAAADPQLHATFDYSVVVSLIHRIQVILDPNNPLEDAINKAASNIGSVVQEAMTERRSVSKLLGAQDKLTIAVRAYLHAP
jgi:hypothetical protein